MKVALLLISCVLPAGATHAAPAVRLGALQKLREFDLSDPVVKAKMRERYGSHVPLDEPVISPGAQFDSPLLTPVGSQPDLEPRYPTGK